MVMHTTAAASTLGRQVTVHKSYDLHQLCMRKILWKLQSGNKDTIWKYETNVILRLIPGYHIRMVSVLTHATTNNDANEESDS